MSVRTTASQTVGPYLHIGLTWLVTDNLLGPDVTGDRITIEGRITDADGKPVDDALVEIWQANAHGRYDHPDDTQDLPLDPGFKGFGRVPTDADGRFRFTTIKPGPVPTPGRVLSAAGPSQGANSAPPGGSAATRAASVGVVMQAPHINVTIFMRGMLKHLKTRLYFPDDPANATDPVLARVPAERRGTLIAAPRGSGALEWNVVLQGCGETVFFDY
ncbi:MAG: protocatechuate 3,4-dioxygenase subunit alpha [Pseudomonadota bacterium]|nr:protocatechuate 3,4-dioxygenase subunit alpha [Pseudomonadota bacterium]